VPLEYPHSKYFPPRDPDEISSLVLLAILANFRPILIAFDQKKIR